MVLFPEYLCIVYLTVFYSISDTYFFPSVEHVGSMSSAIRQADQKRFETDISSCDILSDTSHEADIVAFRGPIDLISI